MTKKLLAAIILAAPLLGGCANNQAIRSLADQTASAAAFYDASTDAFVKNQAVAAAGDEVRLSNLKLASAEARAETDLLVMSWRLEGSTQRLETLAVASSVKTQDILDQIAQPAAGKPSSAPRKGVDLSEAVKSLRGISERPSITEQFSFLREYSAAVSSELDETAGETTSDP